MQTDLLESAIEALELLKEKGLSNGLIATKLKKAIKNAQAQR